MRRKENGATTSRARNGLALALVISYFETTSSFSPGINHHPLQIYSTGCLVPPSPIHQCACQQHSSSPMIIPRSSVLSTPRTKHQYQKRCTTILHNIPTASTVSATISKDVATAAAAASTIIVKYKSSFLSLFFAFLMGGVFFSAAAAAAASVYAFGLDNCRRALRIARIFLRRILESVGISLMASRDVLMGRERSFEGLKGRFKAAWITLMDGFAEARRQAVEGVEAVKLEASLYAGAVGLPGLIPLQYALDRMMPLTLTAPIEAALRDSLEEATAGKNAKSLPNVKKLTLRNFKTGDAAPRLLEARLFDLGPEDLGFDFQIRWDSNLKADIDVTTKVRAKFPVSVRNLRFEGPVRVIVTKLTTKEPGWTAILVSLPSPPKIGLDVRVMGGEFTRVPWIRSEITKAINEAIANEALWPRRVVIPAPIPGKFKSSLSAAQIAEFMVDDPLLRAEKKLKEALPSDFKKEAIILMEPNATLSALEMQVSDGEALREKNAEDKSEKQKGKHVWWKPWASSFSEEKEEEGASPV